MPDEFSKKTVKKFGPRGSPVFEQEEKTTDLEELEERIEQTAVPFCECGAPITATPEVYRCCECELLCCQRCQIERSRYHYCPLCARRQYSLDKRTFLSLVFIDQDRLAPDDLVEVTTQGEDVVELTIDTVADAVVGHDYLAEDGSLSSAGREALDIGRQLYGDDGDIQAVMDQIRLQEVVKE